MIFYQLEAFPAKPSDVLLPKSFIDIWENFATPNPSISINLIVRINIKTKEEVILACRFLIPFLFLFFVFFFLPQIRPSSASGVSVAVGGCGTRKKVKVCGH